MHSRVQQGLHFFLPCIWCLINQNIENTQNATVAMFLFFARLIDYTHSEDNKGHLPPCFLELNKRELNPRIPRPSMTLSTFFSVGFFPFSFLISLINYLFLFNLDFLR